MSCSWTRPARSRSPTSSRSRGRPTASCCSAIRSSSISHSREAIPREPTAPPWRMSSVATPRCHPTRGLFLETTWRLHPDLCDFTSEVFYDDRLEPEPGPHRPAASMPTASIGRRHRAAAPRDPHDRRRQRVPDRGGRCRAARPRHRRRRQHLGEREGRGAPGRLGGHPRSSRPTTLRSARSSGACPRRPASGRSTSSRARRRRSASTR